MIFENTKNKQKKGNIMTDIIGTIASIVGIVTLFVGVPFQIHKNFRDKKVHFHWVLVISTFVGYVLWSWYALLRGDKYLAWSNIPGVFLIAIIVFQTFYYHERLGKPLRNLVERISSFCPFGVETD